MACERVKVSLSDDSYRALRRLSDLTGKSMPAVVSSVLVPITPSMNSLADFAGQRFMRVFFPFLSCSERCLARYPWPGPGGATAVAPGAGLWVTRASREAVICLFMFFVAALIHGCRLFVAIMCRHRYIHYATLSNIHEIEPSSVSACTNEHLSPMLPHKLFWMNWRIHGRFRITGFYRQEQRIRFACIIRRAADDSYSWRYDPH